MLVDVVPVGLWKFILASMVSDICCFSGDISEIKVSLTLR